MPEGTLEVELLQAHELKDVETFGKSDPYALLSCGLQKQRSRTIHEGGSNPVWNQSFLFEIPDGISELDIALYDQERHGKDEAMGTLAIPLTKVYTERQVPPAKHKVQLPDGKFRGELELRLKFFPKVHHGNLEVHLLQGHGLISADAWDKSDPYAVIFCDKQVQKSRVIENGGSDPTWDQTLVFDLHSDITEICVKLFDKDTFTADEPLGISTIPLHKVFAVGHMPASSYKVLGKLGQLQGEIIVGLKFVPKV